MSHTIKSICIVQITDTYLVNRNDVIFKGFKGLGLKLHFIKSRGFKSRTALDNKKYHSKFWFNLIPKIILENIFLFFNMIANIKKIRQSDIIYVASYGNYIILTVKLYSIIFNKKIIFDAHGSLYFQRILGTIDYEEKSTYAKIIFLIDKLSAKLSYKYITLSKTYADKLSKVFNVNRDKFIYAYNGTTQKKIDIEPKQIDTEKIDVLHLSSFKEFHGVLELIDVTNDIVNIKGNKDFKMCLAGRGKLLRDCINKAERLGLSKNIYFPRDLYKESLIRIVNRSKITIGPVGNSQLNEIDFSTKICDYLFFGKIALLPNTKSVRELIEDGVSGFLCNHKNTEDVANKIEYILNLDDKKMKEIEINAVKVFEDNLTPVKIAQKIIDQIFL